MEFDLLRHGIINMRDAKKGCHVANVYRCDCDVCRVTNSNSHCQVHDKIYSRVTRLWGDFLCPKLKLQEWHKLECLMGNCHECGASALLIWLNETLPTNE